MGTQVNVKTESHGEYIVARLDSSKANTISSELISAMEGALDEAAQYRGLIITGNYLFFSAGLDLQETHNLDRSAMRAFIDRFDDLIFRIMTLPIPTVAALSGHTVAGGLLLSLGCDYRIAEDRDYTIGLNQLELGIPLPMVCHQVVRRALPQSRYVQIVSEGMMLNPAEALDFGLVQALSSDIIADASKVLDRLSRAPVAYAMLKEHMNAEHLDIIKRHREKVNGDFVEAWFSDVATQRRLDAIAKLGK